MAVVAAAAATAGGTVGLGAAASPASAALPSWGYEQITPADSSATPVFGIGVSKDMSTVVARTQLVPMAGMPGDGRAIVYTYGIPRAGAPPWTLGPVDVTNGSQIATYVRGLSADGSHMLYEASLRSVDGPGTSAVYQVDAQGEVENMTGGLSRSVLAASENADVVAFWSPGADAPVYLGRVGHPPVVVSVDNDGAPMTATSLGGGTSGLQWTLVGNALAADGSSVIFTSVDAIPGDNDGGHRDVYRRILTPGAERTVLISDANASGDPDAAADADYRWATADHRRVFFVTAESLEPGDTDGEQDLYMRTGQQAPVRISQGETVDGSPTGNGANSAGPYGRVEWVRSSQDGNRTFFVTAERLTQDAPASGVKLYERDVAEGRTRFVAGPLDADDLVGGVSGSLLRNSWDPLSLRGVRVTPNGVVFMSRAPLAGTADDGLSKVFVWTRDGGLICISEPDADAPASPAAPASIVALSASEGHVNELEPILGGRAVSDDGSRVFFTTGRSLTADDTDGGYDDVYEWTAGTGLRLVTPPGHAAHDAYYLDSSPDGTEVYFNTAETVLPGDTDPQVNDVYLAILGGGAAPGKPGPDVDPQVCTGDACQGPVARRWVAPGIGSVSFAGRGNVTVAPEAEPTRASLRVSRRRVVRGSATMFRVKVSGRGRVRVSGPRLRRSSRVAKRAGTMRVAVRLSKRARRLLKRRHRVRLRATVRFTPRHGRRVVKRVRVTFKRPKRHRHGKRAQVRHGKRAQVRHGKRAQVRHGKRASMHAAIRKGRR